MSAISFRIWLLRRIMIQATRCCGSATAAILLLAAEGLLKFVRLCMHFTGIVPFIYVIFLGFLTAFVLVANYFDFLPLENMEEYVREEYLRKFLTWSGVLVSMLLLDAIVEKSIYFLQNKRTYGFWK